MSDNKPFYLTKNAGFGQAGPEDDLLHPEQNSLVDDVSCTESQYLGFSVPEENIHALCYVWHHPVLKTLTGGAWVWQGYKQFAPMSELYDWRAFMDDSAVANDLHEVCLDNGYRVKIVDPLNAIHISYKDEARENAFDLEYTAVTEPVMFGDGNHFEQPMKVRGSLLLRGKSYQVDCYNIRDRSWGKPRQEAPVKVAPITWATCVFNDNFAFNCTILDDARHNTELKGTEFELPPEAALKGGWIYKDGKVLRVVKASKYIERDNRSMLLKNIRLELEDEQGNTYSVAGQALAGSVSTPWPNCYGTVNLTKWETGGMTGYGDCQEAFFTDYLNKFIQPL